MAKEKKLTLADLPTLRKTVFTEKEEKRKTARMNKTCPYKIKRVWDAEKGKYVKTKIYRKRTKLTKKEIKARFGTATETPTRKIIHTKTVEITPNVTHHYCRGRRLDWNQKVLRYQWADAA